MLINVTIDTTIYKHKQTVEFKDIKGNKRVGVITDFISPEYLIKYNRPIIPAKVMVKSEDTYYEIYQSQILKIIK